jgi:hypothetical protein
MSNVSDLKDALVSAAASITNTLDKKECLALIDDWYLVRTAIAALSQPGVTSYSIGGRSVTRESMKFLRVDEADMYARIKNHLYREGVVYVDMRSIDATIGRLV